MRDCHGWIALQPGLARQQQRAPFGTPFGLQKKIGKSRVSLVRAGICQHGLEVRHQIQRELPVTVVLNSHNAQFGIVFRADQHRGFDLQRVRRGFKLHPVRQKGGFVMPVRVRRRVLGHRPQRFAA